MRILILMVVMLLCVSCNSWDNKYDDGAIVCYKLNHDRRVLIIDSFGPGAYDISYIDKDGDIKYSIVRESEIELITGNR